MHREYCINSHIDILVAVQIISLSGTFDLVIVAIYDQERVYIRAQTWLQFIYKTINYSPTKFRNIQRYFIIYKLKSICNT